MEEDPAGEGRQEPELDPAPGVVIEPPQLPSRGSGAGGEDMTDDHGREALGCEQEHEDDVEDEVDVVPVPQGAAARLTLRGAIVVGHRR